MCPNLPMMSSFSASAPVIGWRAQHLLSLMASTSSPRWRPIRGSANHGRLSWQPCHVDFGVCHGCSSRAPDDRRKNHNSSQRGWMCSCSSENVLKERKLTVSPHSNSGNQKVNFFRRINQLSPWQCAAQTEAPITWQQSCLRQDCSFSKIRCFMLL